MSEARKSYRKCCRIKCRQFQMNKADELAKLSKNNPGLFWKKVKKGKKIDKNKAITMMRGKSPRSDVQIKKTKFRGGHLGFLTGISQSILTKLGTHI